MRQREPTSCANWWSTACPHRLLGLELGREPSWFHPDVYALLRDHRVALVIGDRPVVRAFQSHEVTTDFTYVRFHHGTRGARGNYSESALEEWARRFEDWAQHAAIWAYFNNDWEGFAPKNALWLKQRLASS